MSTWRGLMDSLLPRISSISLKCFGMISSLSSLSLSDGTSPTLPYPVDRSLSLVSLYFFVKFCQFVLALLWHFVAVYVLFLAPRVKLASNQQPFRGAEGFVSQLIFIFSKQLHQDLFFSVCPTIFLFWTSAATAAVAVLLQLGARQIRMGSY